MRYQLTVAHHAHVLVKILLVTCVLSFAAPAQTTSATDGSTPLGLQPGMPAGSYALSGLDNVNLYNGNLSFQLSLLGVSGRGGAQMPVMLPIASKWRIADVAIPQIGGGVIHHYLPIQSWWENNERKYSPGSMAGRQAGFGEIECPDGTEVFGYSITRLTFTAPDGTEYELRDQLTGGQPANNGLCNYSNPPSRGTVFITADGSAATFVSDSTIYDQVISPNPGEIYPSGYLLLRDGTRYRIDGGVVSWVRDRNGNKLTFAYDGFNRVSTITDSLKRQVTITYNTGPGTSDQITYKGFGGAARSILVNHASLANALRSDYSGTRTYKSLFPESDGSSTTHHNPTVVASVTLPNSKQYVFKYNDYGELARVVLPTGGAIEYDYAAGITNDYASGITASGYEGSLVIYRRVTERRLYPGGGTGATYASRLTYSRPETTTSNAGYVIADQLNNTGTLLTRSKHYFHGSPRQSFAISPIDYSGWKEGREYQTETFASNGTTILSRVVNTWQQRAAVSWWSGSADLAPPNDPRLSETRNTLVDTNQVSKQTFSYDDTVPFNNRSDVYEYGFGSGAAGALVRRTHTDYLKTNPVNSTDYTTTSIHIRSLPTQTQVFDGSGLEKARTTFEYDNYANDGNHAPLEARSNISGHDSAFTTSYVTRGNLTRSTGWILATSTQLHSYHQFDVAGNVVKTIDPRGFATTFQFTDRYGAPDSEAQGNTAPSELGGQTSYAFATRVTNAASHISYAQFDYYLGRPVNGEDPNGIVASGSYNDSLDRPKQIKRAIGTGDENQTTFEYDDTLRVVTTKSDRDNNNDNLLISEVVYDKFGRSSETRQYEGGSNYIKTEQQYDALGRADKVSNPYRPYLLQTAVWTTTAFDALGRVISVTTPDNSVVSTSYSGNSVTVTDQIGKARKSVTDALGRLLEVYEDPEILGGPPELNYQTSYSYDVLDNLVKVTQGSQQRFFMYDSLKRLLRARNPEQSTLGSLTLSDPITGNSAWSIGYQYDANSNLTQKTDARAIVSSYVYDALNRNTTIDYSNTAGINPDITRVYDTATNGKGRLRESYAGGTESVGANVEHTKVVSYDALGRPLDQRQRFKTNSVWSAEFRTQRGYNRAGAVISQTYPSQRTVSYGYDNAGRLLSFSGTLGDGVNLNYATEILYSPFGGMAKEKFGTDTPLYNKSFYNNRGQLSEIRVGTTYTGPTDTGWQRGALINHYSSQCWGACSGTDNNGNLKQQDHFIPDSGGGVQAVYVQAYSYDSLNRLQRVVEGSWQQEFVYDRWGNRTIHQTNTWGVGINKKAFTVDAATNRLSVPGGQFGTMSYDAAGNLTTDTYTGAGNREYDAENRMTRAWGGNNQWQEYSYNADGQRTRRKVDSVETRQVYGMEGELLAEYSSTAAPSSPQKEYGYRNGQLLVTATASVGTGTGLQGQYFDNMNFTDLKVTRTDATVNFDWGSGTPDPVIGVDTFTTRWQGKVEPQYSQTYTFYTLTDDGVRLWVNGQLLIDKWVDQGPTEWSGQIALTAGQRYDIVMEFYENGGGATAKLSWSSASQAKQIIPQTRLYPPGSSSQVTFAWLVADQLGTPRIILDKTGSLASTKRHDYLPFGEELFAGVGGRTTGLGYSGGDGVRQQFTQKERDLETGLDYFLVRYYSSTQGRFTSPDEFKGGPDELFILGSGDNRKQALPYAETAQPQSLNKYAYVYNNPCRYIDPDGHCGTPSGLKPGQTGICVASYIRTHIVPGSVFGRGDGRGPNGQGGTSRIEVRVAVDVKKGTVTKTDEAMGTSGFILKEAGFKGTGGVQVSSPGKDEKGNLYFQINQHGTSSTPAALIGSIDNHLNMVVTTDGKVGITPSSTAKDYPSLEVFKYTVDDKGNVTTTLILDKKESGNILDLRKKEKPIQADPR